MAKCNSSMRATPTELYLFSQCRNGIFGAMADNLEQALEYAIIYEDNDCKNYIVQFQSDEGFCYIKSDGVVRRFRPRYGYPD